MSVQYYSLTNEIQSRETRTFRVVVGSIVAIVAVVTALMGPLPRVHQSLVMQPQPEPMPWPLLAQRGLVSNAHVQLLDVDLTPDNPQQVVIEQLLQNFKPTRGNATYNHGAPSWKRWLQMVRTLEQPNLIGNLTRPVTVLPRGIDPRRVPPTIVIPRFGSDLELARMEAGTKRTLTGYVRPASDYGWVQRMFVWVNLSPPAWTTPSATAFYVTPIQELPSLASSVISLCICVAIAAAGLIWAGSGGPSFSAWFLFSVPTLISLCGYPLRYGRANFLTQWIYKALGVTAMVVGGYVLWYPGGMSEVAGDLLLQGAGLTLMTCGIASFAGAVIAYRPAEEVIQFAIPSRPLPSDDDTEFRIQRMLPSELCESAIKSNCYAEPRLSDASDDSFSGPLADQIHSASVAGFDSGKRIYVHDQLQRHLVALSLGCQKMVLCELSLHGNQTSSRLLTVLSDGFVVITLPANMPNISQLKIGQNGVYSRSQASDPMGQLAEHLERSAALAEQRLAQVIQIDRYEKLDVFLLARRVLADIRRECGESDLTVPDMTYGRFSFPGQEVKLLKTVNS